jgi:DNA processing protein
MSARGHGVLLGALLRCRGVGSAKALAIVRGERPWPPAESWQAAQLENERALERERSLGVVRLSYFDEAYPQRLREIPAPPALLYLRGDPSLLRRPGVALIGTRRPSGEGLAAVRAIVAALPAGTVVISGLALGVDGHAHRLALERGLPTVAVLAGGLDRPSPDEHRPLAERILRSGGALVSEQPLGTRVSAQRLVARNRLQSGLAQAVVLVQSAARGGSMHTARFALEQGRPLYCVRPPRSHPSFAGNELLLGPARALPELAPAFSPLRPLCEAIGRRPAARPLGRRSLEAFVASLAGAPEAAAME